MSSITHHTFEELVQKGNPVGEVMVANGVFIQVKGLHPARVNSMVLFEDGTVGFVRSVTKEYVTVLSMAPVPPEVGTVAVHRSDEVTTMVGQSLLGRVITPTGDPLDGKGALKATTRRPIFTSAPMIHEREALTELLESGVTSIDSLFPIVKGQRLVTIGDLKSGKSTLVTQLGINQAKAGRIVVYALIAKSQSDIDDLITLLEANDALKHSIIVASTMVDSLVSAYLTPYVACSIAEYFWQDEDTDVVTVYDDLATHAQVYRELSLVSGANPGRDSYPGDIFYIHSSLLERAGKLHRNHKTLTALPVVLASGGDVTAYLPTNIISITDGQWILDNELFRDGLRPAISSSLSVTRVGGRGHSASQKAVAASVLRALTAYAQALEYSHFGADLSQLALADLKRGELLRQFLSQLPGERYSLYAQQLALEVILRSDVLKNDVSIAELKEYISNQAAELKNDESYAKSLAATLKKYGVKAS